MTAARKSGVLLHVTSLPGPFGIGDLGPAAVRWLEALARAGQSIWQFLPLGPPGDGDSPYQCYSAFAGNTDLISPEALAEDGLLRRSDLKALMLPPDGPVDYAAVRRGKDSLIQVAWERFSSGAAAGLKAPFRAFEHENRAWLDDYGLFVALRAAHRGAPWADWGKEIVFRRAAAMASARKSLRSAIDPIRFGQFLFFRQLAALREQARERGVELIGDMPIFVSLESSDVWTLPELFQLDRSLRPTAVAGVPPDHFSTTGQRWGNPLYEWKAMERDRYRWWVSRARAALEQCDIVRIDHFRGFAGYWKIPAREPTAINGRWAEGPGIAFFDELTRRMGRLPFIAEDLGVITPDVEALRDGLKLPGMRVLQFGFGGEADNTHLPHRFERNSVVYTGTHDNDTTAGWFDSLDKTTRTRVRRYATPGDASPVWALIRLAMASVADRAIIPAQDLLELGGAARMNTPGVGEGNWRWRLGWRDDLRRPLDRLGELAQTYGRSVPRPA